MVIQFKRLDRDQLVMQMNGNTLDIPIHMLT